MMRSLPSGRRVASRMCSRTTPSVVDPGKWSETGSSRAALTRWSSKSVARSSSGISADVVGPPGRRTALSKWFVGRTAVDSGAKARIR